VDEATKTTQQTGLASRTQTPGRCLISWIFFLSLNFRYLNFPLINEILCGMLVDFPMIIYFENRKLVSQLSWNRTGVLWMGSLWTSYPGMVLVPCEWAGSGPVILVWNWCPVNGQLMNQLSWYGTGALWMGCWWTSYPGLVPCEWTAVLVWN
jgi:hypothetical protein